MTAIATAQQMVPAPTRQPRRYGLFSVVTPIDTGDAHWMLGGLMADGESCSQPSTADIVCGPTSPAKTPRSWYSDLTGDPWLAYMYETCETVGRVSESAAKLRARFLTAEQSAVELGFEQNVLSTAPSITGTAVPVPEAIGLLETVAAQTYGSQIILHLNALAAQDLAKGALERVGDHLETFSGNVVSIGNYSATGTQAPVVYATGAISLYRSELAEAGPSIASGGQAGTMTNDYYTLIERAYAALVDCFMMSCPAMICGCTTGGGGPV